jgi:hypothetical protein
MHWIAKRLRRLADRIDYKSAPKGTSWSMTFEYGKGPQFNQDGRGCPLWYLGDDDYARAHDEAMPEPSRQGPTYYEQCVALAEGMAKALTPEQLIPSAFAEYNRRMDEINRR